MIILETVSNVIYFLFFLFLQAEQMDFESEHFKSLSLPTQYQIISTARLKSRLRMGLTVDQLEDRFADRLKFSKFQIERVKQRNYLTQKLMNLSGMDENVNSKSGVKSYTRRVAGQRGREYVLQKSENGWTLALEDENNPKNVISIDVDDTEIRDTELSRVREIEKMESKRDINNRNIKLNKENQDSESNSNSDSDSDIEWEDVVSKEVFADDENEYMDKLPESFSGFETTLQRHQLYESLRNKANNSESIKKLNKNHGFLIDEEEDDEDEEEENEKEKETKNQKEDVIEFSINEKLSFKNSIFSKMRNKKDNNNNNDDKKGKRSQSATTSNKEYIPPPWFRNNNSIDSSSAVIQKDKGLIEQRENNNTISSHNNPFSISMDSAASEEEEYEDGLVPYDVIINRRQKNLYQNEEIVTTTTTNSTKDLNSVEDEGDISIITIEDDDEKAEKEEEEEVEIVEERKKSKQKEDENATSKPSLTNEEKEQEPKPQGSTTATTITLTTSELGEVHQDKKSKESAAKAAITTKTLTLEEEEAEAEEKELPKPQYSKEHEEELARQEHEYGIQEDEDLIEQLEKELEETERFTNSFKISTSRDDRIGANNNNNNDHNDHNVSGISSYSEDASINNTNTNNNNNNNSTNAININDHSSGGARDINHDTENRNNEIPSMELKSSETYDEEIRVLKRQAKKELRDADEVTPEMVEECQELLKRFGIPYVTAPMEAEAQCAELGKLRLVDGIVTDDSDCFLFGNSSTTRVFKNMFSQGNKYVECYDSSLIKGELGLDQKKLIKLAYLLGSDYTDGVPGVGPVTAMEILANFDSEDGLIRFRDWWKDVQLKRNQGGEEEEEEEKKDGKRKETEFERKFKKNVTKIFLDEGFPIGEVETAYLHPEVDKDKTEFVWGVPDLDALRKFLKGMVGWSEDKTDELLVPVIKTMNQKLTEANERQTQLKDFFLTIGVGGGVGGGSISGTGTGSAASNSNTHTNSNSNTNTTIKSNIKSRRMKTAVSAISARMKRRALEEQDLSSSSSSSSDSELDVTTNTMGRRGVSSSGSSGFLNINEEIDHHRQQQQQKQQKQSKLKSNKYKKRRRNK